MAAWLLWLVLPVLAGSPAASRAADAGLGALQEIFPEVRVDERVGAAAAKDAAARMARRLLATVPADVFARRLGERPERAGQALAELGRAIEGGGARASGATALEDELAAYAAAAARARSRELARRPARGGDDLAALLTLMVIDPRRFVTEAGFRLRVLPHLADALAPGVPAALREDALAGLNQLPGLDFAAAERIAAAWGAAPRTSAGRRLDFGKAEPRFSSDDAPIAASIYSFPSTFFGAAEVERLLAAVRAAAPRRPLMVLADLPLHRAIAPRAAALGLHLIDTWGRPFSPWPRDPFALARTPRSGGGVVVVARPNAQRGREEDLHLGQALVDALPPDLDRAWGGSAGGVRWTQAPVPFHNGQVLLTRGAAWVSLHTLEPRTLALLGTDRVPVESFGSAAGIARYLAAARRAAGELEALYRRPVRFVHPLPEASAASQIMPADAPSLMRRIGGGAGYDLDSILTLLPGERNPVALVASIAAGRQLLAELPAADWASLRRGYGLEPDGEALRAGLAAAQRGERAAALDFFLDLLASHLAGQGFEVRRLPLLAVPIALLADREGVPGEEFLLTWNNVVVEAPAGRPAQRSQASPAPAAAVPLSMRAEGFSSLLGSGDEQARRIFAAAGCHLDLLPPLVHSVILSGGYRCASNQLRAAPEN